MSADALTALFAEVLNVPAAELSEDTSPDNTPAWDSLRVMELVAAIEDTFDLQLSTAEMMHMRSIGLARSILRAKGARV